MAEFAWLHPEGVALCRCRRRARWAGKATTSGGSLLVIALSAMRHVGVLASDPGDIPHGAKSSMPIE
jgi:hypothetical protein